MTVSAAQLIKAYFRQLTAGCGNLECKAELCRSCRSFQVPITDRSSAALHALELAHNHVVSVLCPNLPLHLLYPDVVAKSDAFDSSIELLAKGPIEVDEKGIVRIITTAFADHAVFAYILRAKADPNSLAISNLAIDAQGLANLRAVTRTECRFARWFDPAKRTFVRFLSRLCKAPSATFEVVRTLIIAFCFDSFLTERPFLFYLLIERIQKLPPPAQAAFFAELARIPSHLLHVLSVTQGFLTRCARDLEPDRRRAVYAIYLSANTGNPRMLSVFINSLRNATLLSEADFDSDDFSNEELTRLIPPMDELSVWLRSSGGGFTFIRQPAVMTLALKNNLLMIYNSVQQSQMMRHGMLRGLPVNRWQLTLEVSRESIVDDALFQLRRAEPDHLLKKLVVAFRGEQGVDVGGVSREFFYLLVNAAFSPGYGLFKQLPDGTYWFRHDVLQTPIYFNVLGTIVALAMYNSVVLPIRFPLLLYKKLCDKKIFLADLAEVDPELVAFFQQLSEMKKNGEDVTDVGLNFSIETKNVFTEQVDLILLKERGDQQFVTNDTLDEYLALMLDYHTNRAIAKQFELFQRGFQKLWHGPLFKMFHYDELNILVSGREIVNWHALRDKAVYTNGYTPDSPCIKWFWEIFFDELSEKDKRGLLRFITGTDREPVGGVQKIIFQLCADPTKLPVAHTCFNLLDLPNYPAKDVMRWNIRIAIENNEGFSIK
jgi:ubiquitin-protein ligase E3 A